MLVTRRELYNLVNIALQVNQNKKIGRIKYKINVMLAVSFNYHGVAHKDFFPADQPVTKEYY